MHFERSGFRRPCPGSVSWERIVAVMQQPVGRDDRTPPEGPKSTGHTHGLSAAPLGWTGSTNGVPWKRPPPEQQARVRTTPIGVDPLELRAGTAPLAHDRNALPD